MTSVLPHKPRRILIVGGGPCGLVSLRNLVERGQFDEVVLAEKRRRSRSLDLPNPNSPRNRPFWPSPAYPALVGNVLAEYLSFSHHPFPEPESKIHPYPSLADTYAYLRSFATPFLASGQIRLSTEVVWVDELPELRGWSVTTRDWNAGKNGERVVVVGNANSSNDIVAQLKSVAKAPVYRSIRRQGLRRFAFLPDPRVIDVRA
ncbi:hypothetical protein K438DRAFT_2030975 [Mycena galopus ATCC 62051]|nr:hypothetical protein K438DRAFT_2030975 [Mycena galopus ATCC 62051]